MNKFENGDHPSEEELMELALKGEVPALKEHVDGCSACAKLVKEFREVQSRVASFDEEEIPLRTAQRISRIARHGHPPGLSSALQALIANPFLIALAVAVVVLLLYFLVGSEVFKAP